MSTEKHCSKCRTYKPLDQFQNAKSSKDGKYSICRFCRNDEQKKHSTLQFGGIDKVLAAQFLGVKHDMSEPYGSYSFGDDSASFKARHSAARTRV
jgi:hypothetical protein